jgi:hypothetical protein
VDGESVRGICGEKKRKKKRDGWVPCVGGWYGVLNMEVDWCGEIGTGLENCDDWTGIFLLEVGFGG